MPDIKTFEQLATGHGVGTAILLMACGAMVVAVIALWRENRSLYSRIESLLKERVAGLEHLVEGGRGDRSHRSYRD